MGDYTHERSGGPAKIVLFKEGAVKLMKLKLRYDQAYYTNARSGLVYIYS